MPYDYDEAVRNALAQHTNVPDTCQLTTRTWCGVPSVGDLDGDGRADAEDGWKSEPTQYRILRVEDVPNGGPASYLGGSHDDGHRALFVPGRDSQGRRLIRSTDAGGWGITATVDYLWPVRTWGLQFVGGSKSCDGVLGMSAPPKPVVVEPAHPYVGKSRKARFLEGGPSYNMELLKAAAGHRADARRCLTRIDAAVQHVPRGALPTSRAHRFHVSYVQGSLRLGLLEADSRRHARSGEALREIRAAIKDLRG